MKERLLKAIAEIRRINQILYDNAEFLYEKRGQHAVMEFGEEMSLSGGYCIDCACTSPILIEPDRYELTCLVCGSNNIRIQDWEV